MKSGTFKKKKTIPREQELNAARDFSVLSPLSCVEKCPRELNAAGVLSQFFYSPTSRLYI